MEIADTDAGSSSSAEAIEVDNGGVEKSEEFLEPEVKKRKLSNEPDFKPDKLELRLGGILCCAVCLDLPRAAIYQVRHSLNRARANAISVLQQLHNNFYFKTQ